MAARSFSQVLTSKTTSTISKNVLGLRGSRTIATFKVPKIENEPNKHYLKDSPDRTGLQSALKKLQSQIPLQIPAIVNGNEIQSQSTLNQPNPSDHASIVASFSNVNEDDVAQAIESALETKPAWETLPFADKAAIFLKAADLISGKYRYEIMAATMLGQGKNVWQAEIDAAAELCDFLRFNVQYAQDLYAQQPVHNSPGVWNRVEYRALEGFVYAVTPFNFTAIAGNLPMAPALMGNVVVWKPSPSAIASSYLVYKIFLEAGLPKNVIQFVPGDAELVTNTVFKHKDFTSLHFTGSTSVFRQLYGKIATGVASGLYRSYPRIVAETGGKNFHLIHPSAEVKNAALQTIRGAFEYQGQKCSACSRVYVAESLWPEFSEILKTETEKLKIGPPEQFENFIGPVIHKASFNRLSKVIDEAKSDPELELVAGGTYDSSKGYFITPSIYKTSNLDHTLLSTELFGPILVAHVYPDSQFPAMTAHLSTSSSYALTGSIFASDRTIIRYAENELRNAAGNFYINTKCTGAVVGQQPFGGGRASGTNDKAGSMGLLSRFVSVRAIKEEFTGLERSKGVEYGSNEV